MDTANTPTTKRPKKRPKSPEFIQTLQTPSTKDSFLFWFCFLFLGQQSFFFTMNVPQSDITGLIDLQTKLEFEPEEHFL